MLAAALVLVLGIWRGRRDLGQRAALGVLATVVGIFFVSYFAFMLVFQPSLMGVVTVPILSVVNMIGSFVPLYVAANWVEVILRNTR